MKRRQFITLAGMAAAWPLAASAQQVGRIQHIGFLFPNSGGDPEWERRIGALTDALRASGWIDGKTAKLEFRWAQGKPELHTQYAGEFVYLGADVIVTSGAAVPACPQRFTPPAPTSVRSSSKARSPADNFPPPLSLKIFRASPTASTVHN